MAQLNTESNKNERIFTVLNSEGYPFIEIVGFLLRANGASQGRIATELGVARSFVHQVLGGKRDSLKVKRAISDVLGFDVWER